MNNNTDVMGPLNELIAKARREDKWLRSSYQDMYFTPDELEAANKDGRFRWGVVNWELRNPLECLDKAKKRLADAQAEVDRIAAKIRGY